MPQVIINVSWQIRFFTGFFNGNGIEMLGSRTKKGKDSLQKPGLAVLSETQWHKDVWRKAFSMDTLFFISIEQQGNHLNFTGCLTKRCWINAWICNHILHKTKLWYPCPLLSPFYVFFRPSRYDRTTQPPHVWRTYNDYPRLILGMRPANEWRRVPLAGHKPKISPAIFFKMLYDYWISTMRLHSLLI